MSLQMVGAGRLLLSVELPNVFPNKAATLLPKEEVLRRGLKEVMSKKSGKFKYDALPHVVQFADLLQLDVDPVPDQS